MKWIACILFSTCLLAQPSIVSLAPSFGSGAAQLFTAVYSHPAGASALTQVYLLINSSLSPVSGCFLRYDQHNFYLLSDSGNAWLGPLAPGAGSTIQNAQCTLYGLQTTASANGAALTIGYALSLSSPGNLYLYEDGTMDTSATIIARLNEADAQFSANNKQIDDFLAAHAQAPAPAPSPAPPAPGA